MYGETNWQKNCNITPNQKIPVLTQENIIYFMTSLSEIKYFLVPLCALSSNSCGEFKELSKFAKKIQIKKSYYW